MYARRTADGQFFMMPHPHHAASESFSCVIAASEDLETMLCIATISFLLLSETAAWHRPVDLKAVTIETYNMASPSVYDWTQIGTATQQSEKKP